MSRRVEVTTEVEIDPEDVLQELSDAEIEEELARRNNGKGFAGLASDTDFHLAIQRGDSETVLRRVADTLCIIPRRAA
jgi:hypothetical protein